MQALGVSATWDLAVSMGWGLWEWGWAWEAMAQVQAPWARGILERRMAPVAWKWGPTWVVGERGLAMTGGGRAGASRGVVGLMSLAAKRAATPPFATNTGWRHPAAAKQEGDDA